MARTTAAPRDAGREGMRARILRAAIRLFARRGIDRVSIREIVAELGVTKPVLYYYFKSKEDLCREIFMRYAAEAGRVHRADEVLHARSLEDRLAAALQGHLEFFRAKPEAVRFALQALLCPGGDGVRRVVQDFEGRHHRQVRGLLRAWRDEGLVPAGAEADLEHLVSAALLHFSMRLALGRAEGLDRGLPGRLARIIGAGVKALAAASLLLLARPCGASAAPVLPRVLTVEEAVELALSRNADVVVALKNKEIFDERVSQYWANALPTVKVSGQYAYNIEAPSFFLAGSKVALGANNQYAASVDVNQVLWSGGKVAAGIKMARLYSDTGRERLLAAREGVKKAVRQLYYGILLTSATVDIQRETLALAREHLATIEAQFAQGLASDLAVLRQKVEVANTEPALTQAANLYEKGVLQLDNLLGFDPETGLQPAGALRCAASGEGELAGYYASALASRPEAREARQQYALAEEQVKLQKSFHYPDLYGFWNRSWTGQDDHGWPGAAGRSWSMATGFKLSVPVFSGLSTVSKVREARLQAEQAAALLAETERRVRIQVKGAWLDLKEAAERTRSQEKAVEQAAKALAAVETRFRNGLSSQLELNDARLALNASRMIHARASHDACVALAELQWAAGK